MNTAEHDLLSTANATVDRQPLRFTLRQLLLFMAIAEVTLAAGRMLVLFTNAIAGPVLPHAIVGQLREGMTKEQVEALLDSHTHRTDDCWYYDPWWNPGWVEVYFEDDRLASINDESISPPRPSANLNDR